MGIGGPVGLLQSPSEGGWWLEAGWAGGGEKELDSGQSLKAKPREFPCRLHIGYKSKWEVKNDTKVWDLSNWRGGTAI